MKKNVTLSVVVTAYNVGESLARTLGSVAWADEIIVVDSSSTDNTAAVARRFTKHVFTQPNYQMLNKNKNFGFTKASGDWILCLDSDEVIPTELEKEIRQKIQQTNVVGFWIPRKNIIFGKWIAHGLWWPDRQLRLFQRGKGKYPCKHVHEYIIVEGQTEIIDISYIHYNYESIAQYLWKMEHIYVDNEVENFLAAGNIVRWYDAVRFPVSDFLKIYFAQEGYKDGLHGLVLALLQAFYSFIIFAKLWEQQKFKEEEIPLFAIVNEFQRVRRDTCYWMLTAKMKHVGIFTRFWYKFLRRFLS